MLIKDFIDFISPQLPPMRVIFIIVNGQILNKPFIHLVTVSLIQCDQIGRFVGLWATFKAFGYN